MPLHQLAHHITSDPFNIMAVVRKLSLHEPCKPICDSDDVQREFSTAADRYPTFF